MENFNKFAKSFNTNETSKDKIDEKIQDFYTADQTLMGIAKSLVAIQQTESKFLSLLKKLYKLLNIYYPNRATLKARLSSIRKVIKTNQPENFYTLSTYSKYFNLAEIERKKLIDDYQNQVETKNQDLIQIDGNAIMAKIQELKNSKKPYEVGVLLMLISGMRPIELFKNEIELIEDKPKYIKFSDLAKKHGNSDAFVIRPIINMYAKDFKTRLVKFRKEFENKIVYDANDGLSKNISNYLTQATRKHFPELGAKGQSASMLRKYYSALSYELFANKKKINFNVWVKNTLGHENLSTSFSYSTIHITDPIQTVEDPVESKEELDPDIIMLYEKLPRTATFAAKTALLNQIWDDHRGSITNTKLRQLSGIGSRIVNAFLAGK